MYVGLICAVAYFMSLAVETTGQDQCYLTQRSPRKPNVALSFCYWAFPAENCCLPGFDTDMAYYYTTLVETSDSCAYLETENRLALKYWFCYGCAKQQPAHLKTLGKRVDGLNTYTLHEISVCPSFAKKLYPEQFDECGLIIPGDRESECFGDDTVIPSQHWGTGEAGVLAFMNDDVGGKPPFFEDTEEDRFVVVIADNEEDCFGNSAYRIFGRASLFATLFVAVALHFV